MRSWVAIVSLALIVACAPQSSTSTSTPAKPAPTQAASSGDAASPEWDRLVAAAKQEGKVTVIIPRGDQVRDVVDSFQQQYGITVEPWAAAGAEIPPRVVIERKAGQYLWDVFLGGVVGAYTTMIPDGHFDPLEPALILPDVKDPKTWRGGDLEFMDEGRRLMVVTATQRPVIYVNTTMASVDEFKSYRDLLDPKWRGQITMNDPRTSGSGQATFIFFYLQPELGPNFIRALGQQQPLLLRDSRQEADSVARGRTALLVGGSEREVETLMESGLPVAMVDPHRIPQGSDIAAGSGGLALFNRAPHPNAARLFVNWLLTRDSMKAYSESLKYVSKRVDVPPDPKYPYKVPGPNAVRSYDVKALSIQGELVSLLKEVFGG